ncbi:MAG: beta-N-acetylhexosaminidase [Pseudorhodoplanes sp.]
MAIAPEERDFLKESEPYGLIIFKRNVENPEQLKALTAEFRNVVGRAAPVLVDQEGGRVQRLGPPHWPAYPPASVFGTLYDSDPAAGRAAAQLGARLIAADLQAVGIDVDCLPLADVPVPGADNVIGDRAYGTNAPKVADLARAAAEGLLQGGVLPVLKHLPGHGRAAADSHLALPVVETPRAVLQDTDFAAFRALRDLPLGMTAHVVFSAFDSVAPATTSAIMVGDVIRGWIGFEGLLMSDDVSMKALRGPMAERTRAAFAAGCDLALHCNGDLAEMRAVAAESPPLAGEAARRAERALAHRRAPQPIDLAAAHARLSEVLKSVRQGMPAA